MSKYGRKEIRDMSKIVLKTYGLALDALKTNDNQLLDQVIKNEEKINKMEKEFKQNHIQRLKKKICNPELEPIYVETLLNLERISDHSYKRCPQFEFEIDFLETTKLVEDNGRFYKGDSL